mgnify:CR=1 FL=1
MLNQRSQVERREMLMLVMMGTIMSRRKKDVRRRIGIVKKRRTGSTGKAIVAEAVTMQAQREKIERMSRGHGNIVATKENLLGRLVSAL